MEERNRSRLRRPTQFCRIGLKIVGGWPIRESEFRKLSVQFADCVHELEQARRIGQTTADIEYLVAILVDMLPDKQEPSHELPDRQSETPPKAAEGRRQNPLGARSRPL